MGKREREKWEGEMSGLSEILEHDFRFRRVCHHLLALLLQDFKRGKKVQKRKSTFPTPDNLCGLEISAAWKTA